MQKTVDSTSAVLRKVDDASVVVQRPVPGIPGSANAAEVRSCTLSTVVNILVVAQRAVLGVLAPVVVQRQVLDGPDSAAGGG